MKMKAKGRNGYFKVADIDVTVIRNFGSYDDISDKDRYNDNDSSPNFIANIEVSSIRKDGAAPIMLMGGTYTTLEQLRKLIAEIEKQTLEKPEVKKILEGYYAKGNPGKLYAIRYVRQLFGWSLVQSKEFVEAGMAQYWHTLHQCPNCGEKL